jgi:carbamoyltransferase
MTDYHLGIYMGHDTGVAIVDDQLNILWVFEEERFNGEKMTYFNPYFSLKEMMRCGFRHFRSITFGFHPDEGAADFLKKFIRFQKVRASETLQYLSGKVGWDEIRFVGHHHAHAAGAFFPSGFPEALVLVADGTGESESTSIYGGSGREVLRIFTELTNDFSLGILYQYFTEWLGYRSHNTSQHCGKIMGLAGYGRPIYKDRIGAMLEGNGPDFRWPGGSLLKMREEIARALGPPQARPVSQFNPLQADVAASIQALLEDMVIEKLKRVRMDRPFTNLCFAGGVAMNSQLNYRILKSGVCEALFVQPLASDRGIALGAALASAAELSTHPPIQSSSSIHHPASSVQSLVPSTQYPATSNPAKDGISATLRPATSNEQPGTIYLGYGERDPRQELDRLLKDYDFPISVEQDTVTPGEVASLLNEGQIIALFQGRQEVGPRALGNRSILAAPSVEARDRTNRLVKYREPWRPFAPSVLAEEVGSYFDIHRPEPHMTTIYGVLPHKKKGIEGITHVDGTARLQSVTQDQNRLFYDIIREYHQVSGIPMVLNTSFNINGQPVVRTVYDAVLTFLCSGIDGLLIHRTLVRKTRDLPKGHINQLDRILSEITRDATGMVIKVMDYSDDTALLLSRLFDCACVKYRKAYGAAPVSRCYMDGHTKMSWNIISEIRPWIREFVVGKTERVSVEPGGICIMVSGNRLIEASSRPTRTYVKFDRSVFRDLIGTYAHGPDSDRYFLLDRENHCFDMDYLNSRFGDSAESGQSDETLDASQWIADRSGRSERSLNPDVREDMVETLADA